MVFEIRKAQVDDLDFLVQADIATDMEDTDDMSEFTDEEAMTHREKISRFITDDDKAAWIASHDKLKLGTIYIRYRQYDEAAENGIAFRDIGRDMFPEDGRFCEVFQLRVEPAYRRLGIASQLKRHAEIDAKLRGIGLIYTHTAIEHVMQMNLKLGYREVRRGTIWDDMIRISLVKNL